MKYSYTSRFHRSFKKLTAAQKETIKKAIADFGGQPHHPFPPQLNVHKLKGTFGVGIDEKKVPIWEMHASGPLIITFQYDIDMIIFRNCGNHDDVLTNP